MTQPELSQVQLQSLSNVIRFEVQAHVREQIAVELASLRQRLVELETQARCFQMKSELDASVSSEREALKPFWAMEAKSYTSAPTSAPRMRSRDTSGSGADGSVRNFQRVCLADRESTFLDDDCLATADDSHEHEPPNSLYNYCMHCLASSPTPLSEKALLYWVILFLVQFITMGAFVVINDLNNNAMGMLQPADREHVVGRCMLLRQSIAGVPVLQYGMGYVALFLVASAIKADDLQSLMAVLPNRDNGIVLWCISRFAWFWQTVYVPGCFALEVATMFAGSNDASAVVMNAVAANFIMEMDNMLYNTMLSEREKAIYQEAAGMQAREELSLSWTHVCARAMFIMNMSLMTLVFSVLEATLGKAKLYGEAYFTWYWKFLLSFYPVVYFGRVLMQYLFSHPVKRERCATGRCIYIPWVAVAGAVLGVACYISSVALIIGRFPANMWPLPQPYVASEFFSCLS
mmetsp:Transcript_52424/g.86942  ORF Transcript_52424/g.86942 Transcript_52424/m.86942 type:complete len:462 (+) Transcript_52424:53-1438(+)